MRAVLALVPLIALLVAGCRGPTESPAPERTQPQATPAAPPALPPLPTAGDLPSADAATDLAQRLAALDGSGELILAAGEYLLTPAERPEGACATCAGDWRSIQPGTMCGLVVSGKGIRIRGAGADRTIIRTRSGSGVLFDGCEDCELSGATVTGGRRDADERATSAAIVVRGGRVTVADVVLLDNVGAHVTGQPFQPGVSGVVAREGAEVLLTRCRILRCSWDGVAVLRGASVTLRSVVIDGVDRASGGAPGGGRGYGIRLAWGARLDAQDLVVARHDGGIGIFGDSSAVLRDAVIEDIPSWGVAARADAIAAPTLRMEGVGVFRTAACGITVRGSDGATAAGELARVRLAVTAQGGPAAAGYCPATALDLPPGFATRDVLAWRTGGMAGAGDPLDVPTEAFSSETAELAAALSALPAAGTSAFAGTFRDGVR